MFKIEDHAAAMGLTVSEFIVRRALGYKVPDRSAALIPAGLLHELSRIGVNINQIAKHANTTGEVSAAIIPTMDLVRHTMERICRRLDEEEARHPPADDGETWGESGPE